MIDYTHPARPAGRHSACACVDPSGHACAGTAVRPLTLVFITGTTGRVVTADYRVRVVELDPSRGAHRPAPVSLVKP